MSNGKNIVGLDIGHVRIGVSSADASVKIASAHSTIVMNEETFSQDVVQLMSSLDAGTLVVGYPRNQSGEATKQSLYVEERVSELPKDIFKIHFQDESLTSVMAKERLEARGRKYEKGDVDAEAAAIILQDYLEQKYER